MHDATKPDTLPLGMKFPRYAVLGGMQAMSDAGLNPFAAQLLAEAHADNPARFGDETVVIMARAHTDTPVFMLLSTRRPTLEQFQGWPGRDGAEPIQGNAIEQEMVLVPRAVLGAAAEALKLEAGVDDPTRMFVVQTAARDALLHALARPAFALEDGSHG